MPGPIFCPSPALVFGVINGVPLGVNMEELKKSRWRKGH